jgi:hypothetical protein
VASNVLTEPGVIALCPRCLGWTMFHAVAASTTGSEWADICRKAGDVIIEGDIDSLREQLKYSCKNTEHDATSRTCEAPRG